MTLRFAKYEGLGNDFVIVDAADPAAQGLDATSVAAICDRHRGIGADGVLIVAVGGTRPSMRVINADGSTAEMCGNGIRCVALHLVRTGALPGPDMVVDTEAGPHRCRVLEDGTVEVAMQPPVLDPAGVPVHADAPLIDAPLQFDDTVVRLTAVSMGNPHAVTFDDVAERRLVLGPRIERDARFPRGVNVGFARPGPRGIELAVWERGAGWTRACGTGACAAAVAAVATGRAARGAPLPVELPGGPLVIVVGEPGEPVRMTGPARHVYDGAYPHQ